jgi:hypothetical protein
VSPLLPFWQRLVVTIGVVLVVSYLAGLLWHAVVGFDLPSYIAGVVGGLAALPIWALLKRVRPSSSQGGSA